MVISFEKCVARPSQNGKVYLLTEHLDKVADGWSQSHEGHLKVLYQLGGYSHDVGKGQYRWQQYVNNSQSKRGEGPPHAPLGSFIFAYLAQIYFQVNGINEREYFDYVARITRDIDDHHGSLQNIDEQRVPWKGMVNRKYLMEVDWNGFQIFLEKRLPVLKGALNFDVDKMLVWEKDYEEKWKSFLMKRRLLRYGDKREAARICLRSETASFIISDRTDAADVAIQEATVHTFHKAKKRLERFCTKKQEKYKKMNKLRDSIQKKVLSNYLKNSHKKIFTLALPTGYGKTIAALKLALEAGTQGIINRIVYVAPYLSILSQATDEIRNLTGLEVLQHHHLSFEENLKLEKDQILDQRKLFSLDTWKAPIITTTFHQLFIGLYPQKAQQAMRLDSLKNSFIIIDEPQIIDVKVWNTFLITLEALVEKLNAQILLISATMPPVNVLENGPERLEPENLKNLSRYVVQINREVWSQDTIVENVMKELKIVNHVGVVLNTVKDSAMVFATLKIALKKQNVKIFNLHGLMIPKHKQKIILQLKNALKNPNRKVVMVSTQMIEAGVDVSFETIFRALPILPSIIQVAGRLNRHNAGKQGKLVIFLYKRDEKVDTRRYVYKDPSARDITDAWFLRTELQEESALFQEGVAYYQELFRFNSHTAYLDKIIQAANGNWSELKSIKPFEEDYIKLAVFVPWEKLIDSKTKKWFEYFHIDSLDALYHDFYRNEVWMKGLSFVERKQFMALMQKFIVNVGQDLINRLAVENKSCPNECIYYLTDLNQYHQEMGFGEMLMRSEQELATGEFL